MTEYDILIVGAGPAGSSAAIQIANRDSDLARRTLVIDKAVFPRPKLCGGGVTTHADALLAQLRVTVDVPSFPIHAIRFVYDDLRFTFHQRDIFRVVRREEFDMALTRIARTRGIELREDEALRDLRRDERGVEIQTTRGSYRAKIVIGADGANSVVRQKLGLARWDRISRLMEILTPADATRAPEFIENTAVFDFTPIARGAQGYYWDFPSFKQGTPAMNRGVFDSRVHPDFPRAPLKPIFDESLARRNVELDEARLQGHPERWYDAAMKHSSPRVLLAGDAAGTEPLFGEGISHALDFGKFAANAAMRAIEHEDFSFADYERRIAWSALGRRLQFKRLVAHIAYGKRGDWFYRAGFHALRMIFGK
ncbi:MAG: FAD-dependent monooxygenase [Chloroflexi bacterium]|nr:FAD-dependent monooxygenase [Chloroflexota bacterium]